jgi:hypothetical protein
VTELLLHKEESIWFHQQIAAHVQGFNNFSQKHVICQPGQMSRAGSMAMTAKSILVELITINNTQLD